MLQWQNGEQGIVWGHPLSPYALWVWGSSSGCQTGKQETLLTKNLTEPLATENLTGLIESSFVANSFTIL